MNVCSDFPLDDSDEKQIDGDNDYATIVGFLHDSLLLVEMNDFDEEYESVIWLCIIVGKWVSERANDH